MNLTDRTDLTGLHDDRVSRTPLNELQKAERDMYFQRISDGAYALHQHAACPICGSDHGAAVARKDRYGIPQTTVVCRDCGLVYAMDPLDGPSLIKFYREQYRRLYDGHEATSAHKAEYHELRFADRVEDAEIFLGQVSKVVSLPQKGTVVEIG